MGGGDRWEDPRRRHHRCVSRAVGTVDRVPGVEVVEALAKVVRALPAGEERAGQVEMARAVEVAIRTERHLIVQAGTGTGKGNAYLIPAILSGKKVVVATATKALQEQLVTKDLPFLQKHLGVPFEFALLKGRSNYICRAALADAVGKHAQGELLDREGIGASRLAEIVEWSVTSETGDRSDLPFTVSNGEWSSVSVAVTECPGGQRCSYGEICYAEDARAAAAEADIVVVNTHLYGIDLSTDNSILPEHDVLIIDEAHAFEDVAADTLGVSVGPGRIEHLARSCRGLFTADHSSIASLDAAAAAYTAVLEPLIGQRVDPGETYVGTVLTMCGEAAMRAAADARALDLGGEVAGRRDRLVAAAGHVASDVAVLANATEGRVVWCERAAGSQPVLRVAPVEVGTELRTRLFAERTVIMASATLQVGGRFEPVAEQLGVDDYASLDAGSPFDYEKQSLLYCAAHLPEPRTPEFEPAMLDELHDLVGAAGGRTLALFTSRRAMEAAAARFDADAPPFQVLVQDRQPRPILQREFLGDETSVLLATMGFWQGFDAPGRTCSLVVIDKLPFARPDDPLAEARRQAATKAKRNAFAAVDLPRAAILLAQGAGRLIRSTSDRGVVAVMDRRLSTASYRWTLVNSLPPMRRTKDPRQVRDFLADITTPAV
ncbi:MAG: ATP-dependent helicase DinG [Actinomycetota bacterium]|nr:ATP-dependent helicase DinG [Actinomycetota bacterium]